VVLRYANKRFQKDFHFIFQIFGILQNHQLCATAILQISKNTFLRYEHAIRQLTLSNFQTATAEESAHQSFSNPVMCSLQQNLLTMQAKVMGTDESCIKIHSLIWGICIKKNPPAIWLTINPADTQDLIALVMCEEDINLDNFCALDHCYTDGTIGSDPYASASFFHFIINMVLESLLGIHGFHQNKPI